MRMVLANPGRFDKGLVLLHMAKGKKRLAAEGTSFEALT
jgi:hypothetical protein